MERPYFLPYQEIKERERERERHRERERQRETERESKMEDVIFCHLYSEVTFRHLSCAHPTDPPWLSVGGGAQDGMPVGRGCWKSSWEPLTTSGPEMSSGFDLWEIVLPVCDFS